MPILGIIASSKLTAAPNSYESIATVTLGSTQTTISFTSIPSTYKHLQVRAIGRFDNPLNIYRNGSIRFNSDTGTNYAVHYIAGDGSSVFADAASETALCYPYAMPDDSTTANVFGAAVFDILDYANTSKYKTVRSLSGVNTNSSVGVARLNSGLWTSTSAITSISFSSNNFTIGYKQHTQFALYGIKD
jgi:hypothetical protein